MSPGNDAAQALLASYGHLVGEDRLEDWLGLFTEGCAYRIVPRDNLMRGLPLALIDCGNREMLADRVAALREANEFNLHTSRHLIGLPLVLEEQPDSCRFEAAFAVYQADQEGRASLFAIGAYRDRIVKVPQGWRFADKMVIVDSFNVPGLLARPL
jgi:3-phenylpropionate/cinnamic acid dioxygenase small subunit